MSILNYDKHEDRDSITVNVPCKFVLDMYHSGDWVLLMRDPDNLRDIVHELGNPESQKVRVINERLFNLARYMRAELHDAELVSDVEYGDLVTGGSARKLETYDEMRTRLAEQADEIRRLREELAVAKSQVENADVNLEQMKLSLEANYREELRALRQKSIDADILLGHEWQRSVQAVGGDPVAAREHRIAGLVGDIEILKEDNRKWRSAFAKYAQHIAGCGIAIGWRPKEPLPCGCGYLAMFAESDKPLHLHIDDGK